MVPTTRMVHLVSSVCTMRRPSEASPLLLSVLKTTWKSVASLAEARGMVPRVGLTAKPLSESGVKAA